MNEENQKLLGDILKLVKFILKGFIGFFVVCFILAILVSFLTLFSCL